MGRQGAASFGGPSDQRTGSAASSLGGFGFSASNWTPQDSSKHCNTCTSVQEYAYAEDRNQRFRPQMEDSKYSSFWLIRQRGRKYFSFFLKRCLFILLAHCIVDKVIPSDPSTGLFAIFDGHGGRQVSDYCAERFPLEIKREMAKNPADMN